MVSIAHKSAALHCLAALSQEPLLLLLTVAEHPAVLACLALALPSVHHSMLWLFVHHVAAAQQMVDVLRVVVLGCRSLASVMVLQ